jgi:hypothetical protein
VSGRVGVKRGGREDWGCLGHTLNYKYAGWGGVCLGSQADAVGSRVQVQASLCGKIQSQKPNKQKKY